jgi:hypothetical protein
MTRRSQLALSGLAGLFGGALLIGGAVWLATDGGLPHLVPDGWGSRALLRSALAGFVLFFSLAEMPLMVFAMRRMAGSSSGRMAIMLTNAAFVCFAAVYAAPFIVLTGQMIPGAALASLCLARLACALLFVRN